MSSPYILEMKKITKQFPKTLANDNVSINLKKGEVLALLGENGAGKSTLMNQLYGLYRPTSGEIILDGEKVDFTSPKDAIKKGLGMVHQHFMLIDTLTVTENIILGSEPGTVTIDYKKAREEVKKISEKYKLSIDPDAKIGDISVGLQQRVEILKALYRKAKILILDEPTAVLTPQEVEDFFKVVKRLKDSGVSIIIITHKLEEVKAISDRVYILRRGKLEGEQLTENCSKTDLANLMVGREVVLTVEKKEKEIEDRTILELKNLKLKNNQDVSVINDLSLKVRPGEIVGIAGVDGNGQSEFAEIAMGLLKQDSGKIFFNSENISKKSLKERLSKGFAYVPADRHKDGLVLPMTVSENFMLGHHERKPFSSPLKLNHNYIKEYAEGLVEKFDVRTPSVSVPAGTLSGGNQQKIILGREFDRDPEFIMISQPTRGLDVGAIEYIHSEILAMRDRNVGIILISMELEEIFALADRICVMYEGNIVKELNPNKTDRKEVGYYMTGGK